MSERATSERDALTTAVLALHAALDGWAAAVVASADVHPQDPDRAVEEPALGASEDAFDEAFHAFHAAASRVLGLDEDDEDLDDDDLEVDVEQAVGVRLYATVLGSGEGDPVVIVDSAGEQVIEALEAAGYVVPVWSVSTAPLEDLGLDDDDEDDDA